MKLTMKTADLSGFSRVDWQNCIVSRKFYCLRRGRWWHR